MDVRNIAQKNSSASHRLFSHVAVWIYVHVQRRHDVTFRQVLFVPRGRGVGAAVLVLMGLCHVDALLDVDYSVGSHLGHVLHVLEVLG